MALACGPDIPPFQGKHCKGPTRRFDELDFEGGPSAVTVHDRADIAGLQPVCLNVMRQRYGIQFTEHLPPRLPMLTPGMRSQDVGGH